MRDFDDSIMISIHALRKESDAGSECIPIWDNHFNPRSP